MLPELPSRRPTPPPPWRRSARRSRSSASTAAATGLRGEALGRAQVRVEALALARRPAGRACATRCSHRWRAAPAAGPGSGPRPSRPARAGAGAAARRTARGGAPRAPGHPRRAPQPDPADDAGPPRPAPPGPAPGGLPSPHGRPRRRAARLRGGRPRRRRAMPPTRSSAPAPPTRARPTPAASALDGPPSPAHGLHRVGPSAAHRGRARPARRRPRADRPLDARGTAPPRPEEDRRCRRASSRVRSRATSCTRTAADFPSARFVRLRVAPSADARAAGAVVAGWLGALSFGRRPTGLPERERLAPHVNLAFTASGLAALGVPPGLLQAFPDDFREGAKARAAGLGDRWPDEQPSFVEADLLLSVHAGDHHAAECRMRGAAGRERRRRASTRGGAGASSRRRRRRARAVRVRRRRLAAGRRGRRTSTPSATASTPRASAPAGTCAGGRRTSGSWSRSAAGGSSARASSCSAIPARTAPRRPGRPRRSGPTARSWSTASSTRTSTASAPTSPSRRGASGMHAGTLEAKIVGRLATTAPARRAGRGLPAAGARPRAQRPPPALERLPLRRRPARVRCPVGAHVRRTNPRDALPGGGERTMRHRIIRRGMRYSRAENGARLHLPVRLDRERVRVHPAQLDQRRHGAGARARPRLPAAAGRGRAHARGTWSSRATGGSSCRRRSGRS